MRNTRAKVWFEAQGRRMRSLGLPLELSVLWPSRNHMSFWAFLAFTEGYNHQAPGGKREYRRRRREYGRQVLGEMRRTRPA